MQINCNFNVSILSFDSIIINIISYGWKKMEVISYMHLLNVRSWPWVAIHNITRNWDLGHRTHLTKFKIDFIEGWTGGMPLPLPPLVYLIPSWSDARKIFLFFPPSLFCPIFLPSPSHPLFSLLRPPLLPLTPLISHPSYPVRLSLLCEDCVQKLRSPLLPFRHSKRSRDILI